MPSSLDLNLGAILIGTLLSSVLFGMVTVQLYVYWQSGYKDKGWTRIAVVLSWILELVWTVCTWVYTYRITVTFYGEPAALIAPHWSLALSCCANGLIGAIVQGYFAYRVRILSRKWPLTIIAFVGSLLQLTGLLAVAVLGQLSSLPSFAEEFNWLVTCVIVFDLATDTLNTAALCYYLRLERSEMGSTNEVLNTLFIWTIQTGLIITVTALVMLIFQLALPTTEMWIGVSLFYGKLYSNTFLASLNGRKFLRRTVMDSSTPTAPEPEGLSFSIPRTQTTTTGTTGTTGTNFRRTVIEMERLGEEDAELTYRSTHGRSGEYTPTKRGPDELPF